MYQITSAMKEYIKTIFSIEENGERAKTTELAKKLHVKPASVTEMIDRSKNGSYGAVILQALSPNEVDGKGM